MVKRIVSIVLLTGLLFFGWFIYKNWNTFDAFFYSLGSTVEDTKRELERNKKKLQDFIDKEENIEVRDLTDEESKALNAGEITEDEAIEIITGNAPQYEPAKPQVPDEPEKPVSTPEPTRTPEPTQTPEPTPQPELTSEEKISKQIAKLYVQKSLYLNKIDDIEAQARYDFENWKGKWPGRKEVKQAILNKYLPTVANWEKECDLMVNASLDELRAEIRKLGKDESIVDTIKMSYMEEKKLKKAYFINRYMD